MQCMLYSINFKTNIGNWIYCHQCLLDSDAAECKSSVRVLEIWRIQLKTWIPGRCSCKSSSGDPSIWKVQGPRLKVWVQAHIYKVTMKARVKTESSQENQSHPQLRPEFSRGPQPELVWRTPAHTPLLLPFLCATHQSHASSTLLDLPTKGQLINLHWMFLTIVIS